MCFLLLGVVGDETGSWSLRWESFQKQHGEFQQGCSVWAALCPGLMDTWAESSLTAEALSGAGETWRRRYMVTRDVCKVEGQGQTHGALSQ